MTDSYFPRTTIVSSNPARKDLANGIFMQSLFGSWPKDKLSQVYFQILATTYPDTEFCRDSRMVRATGGCVRFGVETAQAAAAQTAAASTWRTKLRRSLGDLARRPRVFPWAQLGVELWYGGSWIERTLERELKDLKPEIVYALLGNYSLTRITTRVCRRLGIPVFVHITDDFVESMYRDYPFSSGLQKASLRWVRSIVDDSVGRAGISPIMAREYARRFGAEWSWFTTLVDPDAYDATIRRHDGPMKLIYAGNLGLNRWHTLRRIGAALELLKSRYGIDARLQIYTGPELAEAHRAQLDLPTIEFCGWAANRDLPQIFTAADLLVHVESFDASMAAYTRLSFSTKISQYMMAGRCILSVGPDGLGSMEMIRQARAGCAIAVDDPEAIAAALHPVLTNANLRAEFGARGRRWAMENVDTQSGRERFRRVITAALRSCKKRAAA